MQPLKIIVISITLVSILLFTQFISASSLAGRVWLDVNQDGLDDPAEPGIGEIELTLFDSNQAILTRFVTQNNGHFQFNDLPYSDYVICLGTGSYANRTITWYRVGEFEESDNDAKSDDGCTEFFRTNDSANDIKNIDFGLVATDEVGVPVQNNQVDSIGVANVSVSDGSDAGQVSAVSNQNSEVSDALEAIKAVDSSGSLSSLAGRVWLDVNKDGRDDAEEPGIGGVNITLFDNNQTVLEQVVTLDSGEYQFNNLSYSDYIICLRDGTAPAIDQITSYRTVGHEEFDNDAKPDNGCTDYFRTNDSAIDIKNIDLGLIAITDSVQQTPPPSDEAPGPTVAGPPDTKQPVDNPPVTPVKGNNIARIIKQLPTGSWAAVPGSQLDFLRACPAATDIDQQHAYLAAPDYKWNFYCAGLINAENGGVFDTQANRMILWGGGHADYAGNEVYAYNLDGENPGWEHLNLPSPLPDHCDMRGGNYCSGMGSIEYLIKSPSEPQSLVPASRHTLDTLQFIPEMGEQGSLWAYSGAVWQGGFVSAATWTFDTAQKNWTEHLRWDSSLPETHPDITARPANILQGLDVFSVYDPVTGYIYAHGNRRLQRFDPKTQQWMLLTDNNNISSTSVHSTAAYDYEHNKIVAIGGSSDYPIRPSYYEIVESGAKQKAIYHDLVTTGDNEIEYTDGPGIAYDPDADVFVAWNGGKSIYVLNMQVNPPHWEKVLLDGDDPGPSARMGTFGRLRYVPDKKVFMLVNRIAVEEDGFTLIKDAKQANVFFFKLPAWYYKDGVAPEPVDDGAGDASDTEPTIQKQTIKHLYPLGSIASALAELIAGDTLIIHEGEYFIEKFVQITAKGTKEAPIIIKAAEGEKRPHVSTNVSTTQNTFNIAGNAAYITIKGLEISNANHEDGIKLYGEHISHVTLENLHIHDVSIGVRVATDADHLVIRNNHIHHTGQRRLDENGSLRGFATGEGMYLGCYKGDCIVSHSIIENNLIHDSSPEAEQGDGIELKTRSHDNIIRDNVVYNMGSTRFDDYGGILVWGWSKADDTDGWGDNIIERNVVWGKGSIKDVGIEAVSHAQVRNNIIFDVYTGLASNPQFDGGSQYLNIPVKDVNIVNNTVFQTTVGARLVWERADNTVFANNIIQSNGFTSDSYAVSCRPPIQGIFSKNVFHGELCMESDAGFINSNSLLNLFQDANNMNFWLNPGATSLIGKGDAEYAPADDFNRSERTAPVDIGAYQTYSGSTNPGWVIQPGRFKRQ